MIHLDLVAEPASFEEKVRQPGKNALALLRGAELPFRKKGRKLKARTEDGRLKTVADFPYWQNCLDELHQAYDGICAYYCFYIERVALPHVDHFVAKCLDHDPDLAYEWTNFRLACGQANAYKSTRVDILDPVGIEDGWFQLDLLTLEVAADRSLPLQQQGDVEATIVGLKLQTGPAKELRRRALEHFRNGRVSLDFLDLDHPFLAKELRRQNISDRAQLPVLPREVIEKIEEEITGL